METGCKPVSAENLSSCLPFHSPVCSEKSDDAARDLGTLAPLCVLRKLLHRGAGLKDRRPRVEYMGVFNQLILISAPINNHKTNEMMF